METLLIEVGLACLGLGLGLLLARAGLTGVLALAFGQTPSSAPPLEAPGGYSPGGGSVVSDPSAFLKRTPRSSSSQSTT